jgi:hypothetical protein
MRKIGEAASAVRAAAIGAANSASAASASTLPFADHRHPLPAGLEPLGPAATAMTPLQQQLLPLLRRMQLQLPESLRSILLLAPEPGPAGGTAGPPAAVALLSMEGVEAAAAAAGGAGTGGGGSSESAVSAAAAVAQRAEAQRKLLLSRHRKLEKLAGSRARSRAHRLLYCLLTQLRVPEDEVRSSLAEAGQRGDLEVEEQSRLLLRDLAYNPQRLQSWEKMAAMYQKAFRWVRGNV